MIKFLQILSIIYPFIVSGLVWKFWYKKKLDLKFKNNKNYKITSWESAFFWPYLIFYENLNKYD